ncbi:type VI secretion system baseplate subunit TssE [Salmonella enterica subsp. enterica serovar Eastbourne]|nr:type VI secretion system baseplate subunit TssE [Salmonella enterica subsp. enterica serovar Eastbourne]EHC5910537.1 type VI secretion system baseplate subunit TssE [Salmonella enterica subsp. enterica serovar Eastbourne]
MPRSPGQGSLFERLDLDLPPRRSRTRQEVATERIRAIKRQLEWILNARQGSSQSSPGLGLRDLNDAAIGAVDLRQQVCLDIHAAVAAYEPRARVVDVRPLPEADVSLDLSFRLVCRVPLNNQEERVEIDLMFHHQGRQVRVM